MRTPSCKKIDDRAKRLGRAKLVRKVAQARRTQPVGGQPYTAARHRRTHSRASGTRQDFIVGTILQTRTRVDAATTTPHKRKRRNRGRPHYPVNLFCNRPVGRTRTSAAENSSTGTTTVTEVARCSPAHSGTSKHKTSGHWAQNGLVGTGQHPHVATRQGPAGIYLQGPDAKGTNCKCSGNTSATPGSTCTPIGAIGTQRSG